MDELRSALIIKVQTIRLETGCTLLEACEQAGINIRSYHRWVAEQPEAIELVREYLNEGQRNALMSWSQAYGRVVTSFIEALDDPAVKYETKLKIIKYLEPAMDQLAKAYHASPGGEDRAGFLKKGPTLLQAQSRLATLDLAITEQGVRVDILQDQPVVDGQIVEDQGDTPGRTDADRQAA